MIVKLVFCEAVVVIVGNFLLESVLNIVTISFIILDWKYSILFYWILQSNYFSFYCSLSFLSYSLLFISCNTLDYSKSYSCCALAFTRSCSCSLIRSFYLSNILSTIFLHGTNCCLQFFPAFHCDPSPKNV